VVSKEGKKGGWKHVNAFISFTVFEQKKKKPKKKKNKKRERRVQAA